MKKPLITKIGTIDCGLLETTPIVFRGMHYRFESVRPDYTRGFCPPEIREARTGPGGYFWTGPGGYFRFVDVESGESTPSFAPGHHLGCAHVSGNTVYAYGTAKRTHPPGEEGSRIQVFWSNDLERWSSQTALHLPGWGAYNTTVCKGREGYVMAIEIGEPPEVAGVRFTIFFAVSDDLLQWRLLPQEYVHTKERYAACPALRFIEDSYYMIYAERTYIHIVRSRDLAHWEDSPFNPVMGPSVEDKIIANTELTAEQQGYIDETENIKNADPDLCEWDGRTVIYYCWGIRGRQFLAQAEYEGSLRTFFTGFFPERS